VKITPAHDPNDFEVGRRHKLAKIDVMTDDANECDAGAYAEWTLRRGKRLLRIETLGLLERLPTTQMHWLCERSKRLWSRGPSTQWFCKMKPLANRRLRGGNAARYRSFRTTDARILQLMRNIRDWTLSRQLWWATGFRPGTAATAEKLSWPEKHPLNALVRFAKLEQIRTSWIRG